MYTYKRSRCTKCRLLYCNPPAPGSLPVRVSAGPRAVDSSALNTHINTTVSTDDDNDLFRSAMGDVKPLASDRAEPVRKRPPPVARFSRADDQAVLRESVDPASDIEPTGTGDDTHYRRAGVSASVMRKLRRGQYIVEDELDLHGHSVAAARLVLADFLDDCAAAGKRCVRVIHGKGLRSGHRGPVLRPNIIAWLRRWDRVLAFATARPVDGGTGAMYVLLNRDDRTR